MGSADCEAIALIGANNVLFTARPRKRNFPQTCCTNFLPLHLILAILTSLLHNDVLHRIQLGCVGMVGFVFFLACVGIDVLPF